MVLDLGFSDKGQPVLPVHSYFFKGFDLGKFNNEKPQINRIRFMKSIGGFDIYFCI